MSIKIIPLNLYIHVNDDYKMIAMCMLREMANVDLECSPTKVNGINDCRVTFGLNESETKFSPVLLVPAPSALGSPT